MGSRFCIMRWGKYLSFTGRIILSPNKHSAKTWKAKANAEEAIRRLEAKKQDVCGLEIVPFEEEESEIPKIEEFENSSAATEIMTTESLSAADLFRQQFSGINARCFKCCKSCKQSFDDYIVYCPYFKESNMNLRQSVPLEKYVISATLKDSSTSGNKTLNVNIDKCPRFSMYFSTWLFGATHWSTIGISNINKTKYKGSTVYERVSASLDFSINQYLPKEEMGDDIPDDIFDFLRDIISKYVVGYKKINSGWSLSPVKNEYFGIPISAGEKFTNAISGVIMCKKGKGKKIVREAVIIEEAKAE